MNFYPYSLYLQKPTAAPDFDADGFAIQDAENEWEFFAPCRDAVAGAARFISTESGDITQAGSVIYIPVTGKKIPENSRVQVRDKDFVRLTANVKRHQIERLHERVWV